MNDIAPTPWTHNEEGHIVDANGEPILIPGMTFETLGRGPALSQEQAQAHRRLFFAAPVMYEALRKVQTYLARYSRNDITRESDLLDTVDDAMQLASEGVSHVPREV